MAKLTPFRHAGAMNRPQLHKKMAIVIWYVEDNR